MVKQQPQTTQPDEFSEKQRQAHEVGLAPPAENLDDYPRLPENLPDEVKKNLVNYESYELEQRLMKILSSGYSVYSVDKIILALHYQHHVVIERMKVIRHLRTLIRYGLVSKREGSRGDYSLTQRGRDYLAGATASPAVAATTSTGA